MIAGVTGAFLMATRIPQPVCRVLLCFHARPGASAPVSVPKVRKMEVEQMEVKKLTAKEQAAQEITARKREYRAHRALKRKFFILIEKLTDQICKICHFTDLAN